MARRVGCETRLIYALRHHGTCWTSTTLNNFHVPLGSQLDAPSVRFTFASKKNRSLCQFAVAFAHQPSSQATIFFDQITRTFSHCIQSAHQVATNLEGKDAGIYNPHVRCPINSQSLIHNAALLPGHHGRSA